MPKMEKGSLWRIDKKFLQINDRTVTLMEQWANNMKRQFTELNLSHHGTPAKNVGVALNSFFTHHKLNLLLASCIQVTLYGISKLRFFSPSHSFKGLPSRKVNFTCEKEIPLVWTHCCCCCC